MNTAPLVEARDLARHYWLGRRGPVLKAVDGVSFTLGAGRTLGLVGESGSGKSTLARLVIMVERPTAGELRIAGTDLARAGRAERARLRRLVQMVFQDPYGSLNPRKKVGTIIEEPLAVAGGMSAPARREAVREMMARVGLRPEHYGRYPHMFSGGQRQRVAIARALMLRPRLVVADEPVSALDVSIQAQVLNLMLDLQQEFDLAYLFISHDLSVVRHVADELMVMYLGCMVEQGPARRILEQPLHPYTRALLASTPHADPQRPATRAPLRGELPSPLEPPLGCAFHTRCAFADERCRRERPRPRPLDGRQVACHHAEAIAAG